MRPCTDRVTSRCRRTQCLSYHYRNLVLASNAARNIKLDGVESIEGNLTSEQCGNAVPLGYLMGFEPDGYSSDLLIYDDYTSSNCTGLLSLSSSTLVSVSQNFSLQDFLNITNITFPLLKSVGSNFYLDGLPALSTLAAPNLNSIEAFQLALARNSTTLNINNITSVSSIEINDVGLSALPNLNDLSEIESLAVGGIPNIQQLTLATPSIGTLLVNGNGFLDLWLYDVTKGSKGGVSNVTSLSVSGCSWVHVDFPVSIETLEAAGNSFTQLDLFSVNFSNIYLQSNPQLQYVTWPPNSSIFTTVVVINNPLLRFSNPWTLQSVNTLILKGSFGADV
jgi:hypothetical protein